tara:strand:- start:4008 stop:5483 length:1476 start_codon:yes stop_codon:yes gene_type:complete
MSIYDETESYSIHLQKVAHMVLSSPDIKVATLSKLVGEAGLFDRELASILTVLYSHNNLSGRGMPEASKPIVLLKRIAEDLQDRGFYFPSFSRRLKHIESATNGSFERKEGSQYGGGESQALDRPLRSLREKLYEVRLHDAGHAKDEGGKDITKRTGEETLSMVEKLIGAIKTLETEGSPYGVSDSSDRANSRRNEFLDKRFDEFGQKLNFSVGSTAEGQKIEMYHLHPVHTEDFGERTYAISEDNYALLVSVMRKAVPDWSPSESYAYVDNIIPPIYPSKDRGRSIESPDRSTQKQREQEAQKERDLLTSISQKGEYDQSVVRTIRLPFAPDQIDDNFPSLELDSDTYIGQNVSKVVVESINRMRFSGFVDFDQDYRMMIMWANAPSDDHKDVMGKTYRDLLEKVLKAYSSKFGDLLKVKPEVRKIKRGAALYFPKPISLHVLVKSFTPLQNLLNQTNASIENAEIARGLERSFNREINDDELPGHMENS